MRAAHPRRRDAWRSPTRSSACWRRRARDPVSPGTCRPPAESKSYSEALRRTALSAAAVAALAFGASASAGLQPVKRDFGDRSLPLVRHGTLRIPAGQADGRVRVIVGLPLAPLATAQSRPLSRSGRNRLDVRASSSRTYLARVERAQNAAVAELRRAIPAARVSRR